MSARVIPSATGSMILSGEEFRQLCACLCEHASGYSTETYLAIAYECLALDDPRRPRLTSEQLIRDLWEKIDLGARVELVLSKRERRASLSAITTTIRYLGYGNPRALPREIQSQLATDELERLKKKLAAVEITPTAATAVLRAEEDTAHRDLIEELLS